MLSISCWGFWNPMTIQGNIHSKNKCNVMQNLAHYHKEQTFDFSPASKAIQQVPCFTFLGIKIILKHVIYTCKMELTVYWVTSMLIKDRTNLFLLSTNFQRKAVDIFQNTHHKHCTELLATEFHAKVQVK